MNKYLLSLPLPFLRRQEAMLYAFTGAMLCPGHRSTLVPAQQLPVGLFGLGGHPVCVCWSTHGAMLLGGRVVAWGPVDLPSYSKCGPGQQPLLGAWQKCQISGLTQTSLVGVCSITRPLPPITAGIHVQYLKTQEEVLTSIFIENLPHVRQ